MSDQWDWFEKLVKAEIEPVGKKFGCERVTAPEYQNDENKNRAWILLYESSDKSNGISIDILIQHDFTLAKIREFYWVRVNVNGKKLKWIIDERSGVVA